MKGAHGDKGGGCKGIGYYCTFSGFYYLSNLGVPLEG